LPLLRRRQLPTPSPPQACSHGAPAPNAELGPALCHDAWPLLLHLRSHSPSSIGRAPIPYPSSLAGVDLLAGGCEFFPVRTRAPLLGPLLFSRSLPRSAVRRRHPIVQRADSPGIRPLSVSCAPRPMSLPSRRARQTPSSPTRPRLRPSGGRRRVRDLSMSPCSPSNLGSLLSLHS
jgi:hypothetical protein